MRQVWIPHYPRPPPSRRPSTFLVTARHGQPSRVNNRVILSSHPPAGQFDRSLSGRGRRYIHAVLLPSIPPHSESSLVSDHCRGFSIGKNGDHIRRAPPRTREANVVRGDTPTMRVIISPQDRRSNCAACFCRWS